MSKSSAKALKEKTRHLSVVSLCGLLPWRLNPCFHTWKQYNVWAISFAQRVYSARSRVMIRALSTMVSPCCSIWRPSTILASNAVGSRMWEVLTTSESAEAAYTTLLEEYEVEPEILRNDLAELVGRLRGTRTGPTAGDVRHKIWYNTKQIIQFAL